MFFEDLPIHTADYLPGGTHVVAAGRRKFFYVRAINTGHDYFGHNYIPRRRKLFYVRAIAIGRNYLGHNCVGHNYIPDRCEFVLRPMSPNPI